MKTHVFLFFNKYVFNFILALLNWLEPQAQCWIEMLRIYIFALFLILNKNISSFSINTILALVFLYMLLIRMKNLNSISSFLRVVTMDGYCYLQMHYCVPIEMNNFIFFILFMWYTKWIKFKILNQPCITVINSTFSCRLKFLCVSGFGLLIF